MELKKDKTKAKLKKPFIGRGYKKKYDIYYTHPISGKRTKISTKTRIRTDAEIVYRKFMCQFGLNTGSITGTINKKLSDLRDLIIFSNTRQKSPSTLDLYKSAFDHMIRIIGDKYLSSITRYECDIYVNELLNGRSKTTVNIYFRNMRSAFNIAISYGFMTENPFRFLKELITPEISRPLITEEEIDTLFKVIDNELMLRIVKFALLSGMRLGEIAYLQWSDVDFVNKIIHIKNKTGHNTKTRKDREISLTAAISQILFVPKNGNIYNLSKNQNYVFCKANGFMYSSSYISHKFKEYVKKAKINDKICFHCNRHTAATKMSNSNIPINIVQKILGHASNSTTMKYLHADINNIKQYMDKVDYGF